jgi:uncharacterized protein YqfA (UPF0365 family)
MIFRMIHIYFKAKKGIKDPAGLAGEEVRDLYMGTLIIPGVILGAVVILLGILSFTHWIAAPSLTAKIFFWILFIVGLIYGSIAMTIAKFLNRAVRKGEDYARSKLASQNHGEYLK